jgi:SWI/SNF-related matrix-associated actin-dependent regulator of chromatin subfamily A-like protein 1
MLDYNPTTGAFILRVPAKDPGQIAVLMRDHGLDFSTSASTEREAVLFTREPYCAAAFADQATEAARQQLAGILEQVAASWAPDSSAHIDCPPDKELWGFQKADIEYALARRNTLVGDQPGLGKTPIAICYANEIRAKRVLVICPASIRLQWVKRIREWSTMKWPFVVHPILNSRNGVHPTAAWTVLSYELARQPNILKALLVGSYDLLIMDEAHYVKTRDARRTRAIFGGGRAGDEGDGPVGALADRCQHILALTGTPLPNRPHEAYTLARGLHWDSIDFMSEDKFAERFNPRIKRERVDPSTGQKKIFIDERTGRHAELQNRLRANFMTRHLKRDVMTQLQLPVYDLIQLQETAAVKQALAAESLLDIDPEDLAGADAAILGDVATARRMMGLALAPQVVEYIDMLIDGGEEKIVLFAWHTQVLDIFEAAFQKHGVVRVDGATSSSAKERRVKAFIEDQNCNVIIGNTLSLGTGTDGLQLVSNHALNAEPDWVPGNNIQCFDRLDRGGQTRQVQGDIFVAPNSLAERVLASSLRKLQTTHKALDQTVWQ